MSEEMTTAENVTDEQIRELMNQLRLDGKWTKRHGRLHWSRQEDIRACYAALSTAPGVSKWTRESGRAHCATLINAYAKANDLEIKLSLAQTRLAQATEACTALTLENERLRSGGAK